MDTRVIRFEELSNLEFYQFPKWLMQVDISNDARVIYMLTLDRFKLSVKNGWKDKDGNAFCFYKREEIAENACVSIATVYRKLEELKDVGLWEERKNGFNEPNSVYLSVISQNDSPNLSNLDTEPINLTPRTSQNDSPNLSNLKPNKNKFSNNKFNNNKKHICIGEADCQIDSSEEENTEDKKSNAEDVKEIVEYLNAQAEVNYKPSTPKTKELIKARLREGFVINDFKTVIDKKCADWKNDENMSKFLRPVTLFGTKFECYLNQKGTDFKHKDFYEEMYERYGDNFDRWDL